MVIYESLRLYTPGPIVPREAVKDLELGGMKVPKGVNVWIMLVTLHQDPNFWGPNVDKFNPERFSNGISGACKHPQGYMPFGVGPHTCLGQHFAIAELKILLTILLSNFRFTLSPKYRHSPIMSLLTEPEYGVHLFVRKI
ncbi:Cytochrome P450 [Corchorus olitorius]|uniref:Cytochrome P450 n=1 Tax=Corchorus olitorius TaxID=93759 RepID=A0A1R3H911_9ROSI|nr:Cytochrome P450 [Corchorus olitorius]